MLHVQTMMDGLPEPDTAAKTPFDCMRKLENEYVIDKTSLGGNAT